MFKVVVIVDKKDSAIDRLAEGMKPYMRNVEYVICDVHPKRPDPEQLSRFEQEARTADIIDAQYYRTADMLRQRYDWLKQIPTVLTHHNPYAITERDWNDYGAVIGINRSIFNSLKDITSSRVERIGHAVDYKFWRFNENYSGERSVLMVANRIEGKKGILPVAEACKKLNLKMYLVGNISDMDYFYKVMQTNVVEFFQNIPDEKLLQLYHKAGIHVCNSVDNFESGTMPILEAIFAGCPVLTRNIGHVPEWANKENAILNHHDPEDIEHLTTLLSEALADKDNLLKIRDEAWFAIKDKNFERRAYSYQKLYRELISGETVSVIMPVADRTELTSQSLNALANQTHKNIELIVIDDGTTPQREVIESFAQTVSYPVRYMRLDGIGYNLAKARNMAVVESTGNVLVFCDQRIAMEPNAIEVFLNELQPRSWLYGDKGAKKDWVENFSCVYRDDCIALGPFNERITQYGGMTQDMRTRARKNGYDLRLVDQAKAVAVGKSSNRRRKRYEIMASKNLLWKEGLH